MSKLGKYSKTTEFIVFDGWHVQDPEAPTLRVAMNLARRGWDLNRLEILALYQAAEAYVHLTTHPAPTRTMTKKLQQIRATIKKEKKNAGR